MLAMQYVIGLPADYDMEIIYRRIATRGAAMDAFPGLGFKAYGTRERGVDGAPVNEYAPFYLWRTVAGMNAFLWGDGFAGICRDFGRPEVKQWAVVDVSPGPARSVTPTLLTCSSELIALDSDPRETVETARARLAKRASGDGVHTTAVAVDARRWELRHVTLWADDAPAGAGTRYAIGHFSAPGIEAVC